MGGPKNNYKYCKECKCLDCTFVSKGDACVKSMKKSCGAPNWKGDGNCDDNNNNAGCTWDGGDCCGAKNYGYCDDNNNYGGCAWDGGDCCGDKANIKYCKLCECKDCTKKKAKSCPGKQTGCKFPNYKKDK